MKSGIETANKVMQLVKDQDIQAIDSSLQNDQSELFKTFGKRDTFYTGLVSYLQDMIKPLIADTAGKPTDETLKALQQKLTTFNENLLKGHYSISNAPIQECTEIASLLEKWLKTADKSNLPTQELCKAILVFSKCLHITFSPYDQWVTSIHTLNRSLITITDLAKQEKPPDFLMQSMAMYRQGSADAIQHFTAVHEALSNVRFLKALRDQCQNLTHLQGQTNEINQLLKLCTTSEQNICHNYINKINNWYLGKKVSELAGYRPMQDFLTFIDNKIEDQLTRITPHNTHLYNTLKQADDAELRTLVSRSKEIVLKQKISELATDMNQLKQEVNKTFPEKKTIGFRLKQFLRMVMESIGGSRSPRGTNVNKESDKQLFVPLENTMQSINLTLNTSKSNDTLTSFKTRYSNLNRKMIALKNEFDNQNTLTEQPAQRQLSPEEKVKKDCAIINTYQKNSSIEQITQDLALNKNRLETEIYESFDTNDKRNLAFIVHIFNKVEALNSTTNKVAVDQNALVELYDTACDIIKNMTNPFASLSSKKAQLDQVLGKLEKSLLSWLEEPNNKSSPEAQDLCKALFIFGNTMKITLTRYEHEQSWVMSLTRKFGTALGVKSDYIAGKAQLIDNIINLSKAGLNPEVHQEHTLRM